MVEIRLECFRKWTGVEILLEMDEDITFQYLKAAGGWKWEMGEIVQFVGFRPGLLIAASLTEDGKEPVRRVYDPGDEQKERGETGFDDGQSC